MVLRCNAVRPPNPSPGDLHVPIDQCDVIVPYLFLPLCCAVRSPSPPAPPPSPPTTAPSCPPTPTMVDSQCKTGEGASWNGMVYDSAGNAYYTTVRRHFPFLVSFSSALVLSGSSVPCNALPTRCGAACMVSALP